MLPDLRISIDCDPEFRKAAQYALATLALIAGRRVRFVAEGADLHYGRTPHGDAVWLPASSAARALLEPVRLQPDAGDVEVQGVRILGLFPVNEHPAVPTDIVAAAFFFLSLHEEWTAVRRDQFGRALATEGLLGRRGEVDRPVVAEYARLFATVLGEKIPDLRSQARYRGRPAAAVMTHDIDYLSKFTPGLLFREAVKNFLFNRRHVSIPERLQRLREYLSFSHRNRDPYVVSIERMLAVEQGMGITGSWLFKAGGNDRRDVTYSLSSARARETLSVLRTSGHDIGLHPSFNAHNDPGMLAREAARLRQATGAELRSIRQHYLRFEYPTTWRLQSAEGFFVDSTLGFAEQEGFRNGVCHPFLPWDLAAGAVLPIWEIPLTVMDGTLAHYRGLEPERASQRIAELLDTVSAHGGSAVLLFHNTSHDAHDFPGWGAVFEDAAARIADGRFFTGALPEVVLAWHESAGYASTGELLQVINSEPVM